MLWKEIKTVNWEDIKRHMRDLNISEESASNHFDVLTDEEVSQFNCVLNLGGSIKPTRSTEEVIKGLPKYRG